jgi:hypothetical protein
MRLTVRANVLLVICAIAGWFAIFVLGRSSVNLEQGELRCESPGAVIINVWGDDYYGVNAIGAWRYPPLQRIWNNTTYPETNIDRIIDQGLTLCDWQSVSQSDRYAQR